MRREHRRWQASVAPLLGGLLLLVAGGAGACVVSIPEVATSGADSGGAIAPGSCGLAAPAFCETFDAASPGGRGGNLDEARWNVARVGSTNPAQGLDDWCPAAPLDACGGTKTVLADQDLVVCGGQLAEVPTGRIVAMRVRQPVDLDGASAAHPVIVAFDVDAAGNADDTDWIDVWLLDQALPWVDDARTGADGISPTPRNGLGFSLDRCPLAPDQLQLAAVYVSANGTVQSLAGPFAPTTESSCFGVASGAMNHVELHVAATSLELWASDAGQRDTFRKVASAPIPALPLSRGYVTLEHLQTSGVARTHHWDNVGFDGPAHPAPHAVDAPDALASGGPGAGVNLGYALAGPSDTGTVTLTLDGVNLAGARSAHLDLDLFAFDQSRTLRYCFDPPNGACHDVVSPFGASQLQPVSLVVEGVDLAGLQGGRNTIGNVKITTQTTPFASVLSNVTLTVEVE